MTIIGAIYSIIQLVLQLFGLWDQFLSYSDKQRLAEDEAKTEARNKAVDDSKTATDDTQIWKDQDTITRNKP